MGGHGGLNILPQKKWNVYNQDNRLKVARDEAAHAEREKQLAEKHAAAEREQRLKILKERARQRHGGAASINLDAHNDQHVESPAALSGEELPYQSNTVDATAAALNDSNPMLALETKINIQQPQPKRQRREQQRPQERRPPSLAHLAGQFLDAAPSEPQIQTELPGGPSSASREISFVAQPAPPKLEHVNLFAEEEARVRNPETLAEQRQEQTRRGDMKTQTTDARFDESFGLAYGLTGKAAMPWYANPAMLHSTSQEEDLANKSTNNKNKLGAAAGGGSAMEEWRRKGQAALAASAAQVGVLESDEHKDTQGLLHGVKVIIPEKRKKKQGNHSTSEGTSEIESDEEDRKNRRRTDKRKEKKEDKKKRKRDRKVDKPATDTWSLLREERLKREEAERVRQKEAVRAAMGGTGPGGRRYYGGYGHGH